MKGVWVIVGAVWCCLNSHKSIAIRRNGDHVHSLIAEKNLTDNVGAESDAKSDAELDAESDAESDAVKDIAVSYQPLPDTHLQRDGRLLHLSIPAAWGTKPYGMGISGDVPTADLGNNQIYTDDSANGFRIRKGLLDMHNYVRKLEARFATYMNKVTWDFHLEAYSRQWATRLCTNPTMRYFEHSPDSSTGIPKWPDRISSGENLYASSGIRPSSDDFSDVVSKWFAEREFYDWSTGGAKPGATQPVGHWKQLVRPQVTAVGCTVVSNCKNSGDWRTFVVCHYDYGNIGKNPYEPNTAKGPICSRCPNGFTCCEQGLCDGKFSVQSTGLAPFIVPTERKDAWYGCTAHKRSDCHGTGASAFLDALPNDKSGLEFNPCHCGAGPLPANFVDTVTHGYFWFRNKCFEAVAGTGDDLSGENSLYSMLQLSSENVSPIYGENGTTDNSHTHVVRKKPLDKIEMGENQTSDVPPPPSSEWSFSEEFHQNFGPHEMAPPPPSVQARSISVSQSVDDDSNEMRRLSNSEEDEDMGTPSSLSETRPFTTHVGNVDEAVLGGLDLGPKNRMV